MNWLLTYLKALFGGHAGRIIYWSGGVHGVVGKPRSGKSMAMVISLIEELVNGSRTVVTNLPLRLPQLNAYIGRAFPWANVDLHTRLRIVQKEDCFEFWRRRGAILDQGRFVRWLDLPPSDKDTGECSLAEIQPVAGADGEFTLESVQSAKSHRCAYYIDEVHAFFNAREWMKRGKGAVWYVSQHGKLGDACILATHMVADIDKQMRGRFQDWTYLRNLGKEKLGSVFVRGSKMVWFQYQEPKQQGTTLSDSGDFSLDVEGIGSCYETDGGVGIASGSGGDKGERAKGLPIWAGFFCIACVVLLAWWGLPKMLRGFVHGASKGLTAAVGVSSLPGSAPVSPPVAPVAVSGPAPVVPVLPGGVPRVLPPLPPERLATGYVRRAGVVTVFFSDGVSEDFLPSQVSKTGAGVLVGSSSGPVLFKWNRGLPVSVASPTMPVE